MTGNRPNEHRSKFKKVSGEDDREETTKKKKRAVRKTCRKQKAAMLQDSNILDIRSLALGPHCVLIRVGR